MDFDKNCIHIIENTDEAREKYHKDFWGSQDIILTAEQLQALIDGKTLIWDDGEYSNSITRG